MIQPCLYTNDMQGGVENYLAQNDSNNEYKLMLGYINPARKFLEKLCQSDIKYRSYYICWGMMLSLSHLTDFFKSDTITQT